jgi:hypothetical protein
VQRYEQLAPRQGKGCLQTGIEEWDLEKVLALPPASVEGVQL